jgi:hypothetical protein
MKHKSRSLPLILATPLLTLPTLSLAEISVRGFGSIVAGYVADGDGYIAEYPNLAVYDSKAQSGQETRLGIQLTADLNEQTNLTSQVMFRGANEYEPEMEWLYITHYPMDNLDIQAGRMRMPVYQYSEYMDVGFAFPWVRIPSDAYSLDAVNYNGARINYLTGTEDIPMRLSFFTGSETVTNSELMSYLFEFDGDGTSVSRQYDDIAGLVLDTSYDFINLRLSYTRADMLQTRGSGVETDYDISFFDAAIQLNFGDFSFISEYNKYKPFYQSFFYSLSYTLDSNAFYLMWSKFDLDEAFEEHTTQSLGHCCPVNTEIRKA